MEMSSTRISDLPENVSMPPFGGGAGVSDRGIDMASASYRQMNTHQNPYMQGQDRMDSMPPPAFKQGGRDVFVAPNPAYAGQGGMGRPPPPIPPSYDFDQGPLGNNAPQYPLPPKDIPIDTSGFRDESARPNYVPPAPANTPNFVAEQEERLRDLKHAEATKRAINEKFDLIAELQMPIIVGMLFLLFQMGMLNQLFARYLGSLGLFEEDGSTMSMKGIVLKSLLFGGAYYGIIYAMKRIE
jgi:hypothetical protein